jgi:hypothetical protein
MVFEFYTRVTIFPGGRVMLYKSPFPLASGVFISAEEAVPILEEIKKRFNEEIDEVLRVLRSIKEFGEKYK